MIRTRPAEPEAGPACWSGMSGGKTANPVGRAHEFAWRGILRGRSAGLQSGSGSTRIPRNCPARVFGSAMGVPHPHRISRHYSIVVDKVPAGRTYLRAVFPFAARKPLTASPAKKGVPAVVASASPHDILKHFFHENLFTVGVWPRCPRNWSTKRGDLFVLRPLAHVAEQDCERFARAMGLPIIPCDLCDHRTGFCSATGENKFLTSGKRSSPAGTDMFRALTEVLRPSHLLDPNLVRFVELTRDSVKFDQV